MRTFSTRVRARYAETDAAEVLYYGSFMQYFEVGKMEMYRELGLPYSRDFPIVEVFCRYLAPAHFDELLEIRSRFDELREKSVRVASEVLRVEPDGSFTKIAEGYTTHVHVNEHGRAAPLPPLFAEVLARLEDG
jgi:acyl-CoA thioester hydrolase